MVYRVAITNAQDDNIDGAVNRAIELVGDFKPHKGATIAIKPNLCSIKPPDSGVTTDIHIVEAVIKHLKNQKRGYQIIVIESNSDYSADEAFERLGYKELEEKYSISLCNLSKDKTVKMEVTESKKIAYFEVPETILFVEYLISVAKLKTHAFERISGIWKNQFGLIPRKSIRPRLHPFLSQILFDLNKMFYPDLSIIDGIYALEGLGPLEGKRRKTGIIICSKNPLSADIVASKVMGFNFNNVPHVKYALKHGFKDAENIVVVGDAIKFMTSSGSRFMFTPFYQYKLYRLSLFLGRISRYLENFGEMFFVSSYAVRAKGFRQLLSGRLFSLKKIVQEVRELLFKVEC